jgi:hypothetical protein
MKQFVFIGSFAGAADFGGQIRKGFHLNREELLTGDDWSS